MRISLDIEGIDDMIKRLERAGKDVEKATTKALRAGARVLAEGMKEEVPVSDIEHLHIRDDIKVRQTPKKERLPGVISYDIGPGKETAWRARFVHNGFVSRNGRFVRGNPFATRAFRLKREAITNAIIREYQKALR
ncbi:HK97 gp10 family phage protein [Bacillus velezensis]|uniref:HK97-gp10 family putative phage morphogenesis protein n=1 Tax=Bacillus velezensis TaxID=492670 RepID=UPI002DBC4108|nr:HK97-gp10 family putative phage morphogenesis protein [Bacillus velezensis]MEC1338057.1 HK97 gp10 family phage protein [Bacillus velezensis]